MIKWKASLNKIKTNVNQKKVTPFLWFNQADANPFISFEQESVRNWWWRSDRQCLFDWRHYRPVRCRVRCNPSLSDHWDVGRIDSRCPINIALPADMLATFLTTASQSQTELARSDREPVPIRRATNHMETSKVTTFFDSADMGKRAGIFMAQNRL